MPARINISIVDKDCIKNLIDLRKKLEETSEKRFSLADVVKHLVQHQLNTANTL